MAITKPKGFSRVKGIKFKPIFSVSTLKQTQDCSSMMDRLVALVLLAFLVSARRDCVDGVTYFAEAGKTDIYRWSSKEPITLKKRTLGRLDIFVSRQCCFSLVWVVTQKRTTFAWLQCDPSKYYVEEKRELPNLWDTRRYENYPILSFSQRQQLSQVVEVAFLNNVLPYINSGKNESIIKCETGVNSLIVSDYQVCYLQQGTEANVNGKTYTSTIEIDRDGSGKDQVFGKYSVVVSYSCNGQARERSVGFTFEGKATIECTAWHCLVLMLEIGLPNGFGRSTIRGIVGIYISIHAVLCWWQGWWIQF